MAAQPAERQLHWLEGAVPEISTGVTWGVPWPRGTTPKETEFALRTDSGESVPVQSWPLAYWPDGSLKWTAHAIGADAGKVELLTLAPGTSAPPAQVVTVEDAETITIDTGVIQCRIAKSGGNIIDSISRDGKELARNGELVCLLQNQPESPVDGALKTEKFVGEISSVTVEQIGPVRAVVKIEGKHANPDGRAWLPFVLRLYFYSGGESVRIVHTIIYDGDQHHDFIRGLGMRFGVPIQGPLHDRHVRFSGEEDGLWAEAVRGITGLRRDPGEVVRKAQIYGIKTPPLDEWSPRVGEHLNHIPAFGDFTLSQTSADSFEIRKRTREGFTWLSSAFGHRAAGLGYLGTPDGGLAFGIRDFWQSYPSQLDIRGAAGGEAEVTLWLWGPDGRPMDMRFYHDGMGQDTHAKQLEGLDVTYEDYEPGFATPEGVARTNEMQVWALPATPSRDQTVALARVLEMPPQLVGSPGDYKSAEIFGGSIWGLPDRSTPSKAAIEDQLDFYFDYYRNEVEQRHWYGFWNYGDVMHTYDADRHVWRYDVGGFAWDNSELSTDLWLWYSFLRTGRADIYRMAEAMTRHTGEVDVYHLGRFAGLGSRHNVVHWGDSAKQLRISTAANRRFLYFLTADERIGDLLWEVVDAETKLKEVRPDRKIRGPGSDRFPMSMGVGTDWCSVAAAQLTAWERTGDDKYRNKLVEGMEGIAGLAHGWLSGHGGYDPETGAFFPDGDDFDVSHLSVVFGGVEINAELLQLLDVPEYERTWLQYCELYNAPPREQRAALGQELGRLNLGQAHSRLTAYAAWKTNNDALAKRAWKEFFGASAGVAIMKKPYPVRRLTGPDVLTPIDETLLSTNATAQFGLAAIQDLALVGDAIPDEVPDTTPEEAPEKWR